MKKLRLVDTLVDTCYFKFSARKYLKLRIRLSQFHAIRDSCFLDHTVVNHLPLFQNSDIMSHEILVCTVLQMSITQVFSVTSRPFLIFYHVFTDLIQ